MYLAGDVAARGPLVAVGEGRFAPRKVTLGESDGTYAEVISGLSRGERVVSRANFLIDSESRLRASLEEMASPERARVLPETGEAHGTHP